MIKEGDKAPAITITTSDGGSIDLALANLRTAAERRQAARVAATRPA
jgi:hypothetical protein